MLLQDGARFSDSNLGLEKIVTCSRQPLECANMDGKSHNTRLNLFLNISKHVLNHNK